MFAEVEVVRVRSGSRMADVQRNLIQFKIMSPVQSFSLKIILCKKTNLLVGVIVLEDFWLHQPSIIVHIYFVL